MKGVDIAGTVAILPMKNNNSFYHIDKITKILNKKYLGRSHYNKDNPLDELLFILCSIKRSERVYIRAYKSLKRAYPTFAKLNQASVAELTQQIRWGGLQNHKASALKSIMTAITEKFGRPTLAPLRKMSELKCEQYLCSLPGVGKKVARCVMLYSLEMNVFPVDTHCWRISKRLGWITSKGNHNFCSSRDMDLLQEIIPPKLRLALHVNMLSLGRDTCLARSPKCDICVITEHCPKIVN